jgi:hypothetical protein
VKRWHKVTLALLLLAGVAVGVGRLLDKRKACLLYTSDAADDM